MRRNRPDFTLLNYEGYKIYELTRGCFLNENPKYQYFSKYPLYSYKSKMLFSDSKDPFKGLITEMQTLPDEGSIWVHPSCKVFRQHVYAKYKKVRDPWKADIVVIHKEPSHYPYEFAMVSVNEKEKLVVLTFFVAWSLNEFDTIKDKIEYGKTRLCDIIKHYPPQTDNEVSLAAMLSATVVRTTMAYSTYDPEDAMFAIYNGDLPSSNIIYDSTLIEKMSESASIDMDDLVNIYDMLVSKDSDTQGIGLVTLANLPYAQYRNSVVFILDKACRTKCDFTYHGAMRYKAVDTMLKFLQYYRLHTPYSKDIKRCDWQLLKQLLGKYDSYNFHVLPNMGFLKLDYDKDMIYPLYSD